MPHPDIRRQASCHVAACGRRRVEDSIPASKAAEPEGFLGANEAMPGFERVGGHFAPRSQSGRVAGPIRPMLACSPVTGRTDHGVSHAGTGALRPRCPGEGSVPPGHRCGAGSAGWPPEQPRSALAAYADVEFPVPVPSEASLVCPRLSSSWSCSRRCTRSRLEPGSRCSILINRAFPAPEASRLPGRSTRGRAFAVGVAGDHRLPRGLHVAWYLAAELARSPIKRLSAVRRRFDLPAPLRGGHRVGLRHDHLGQTTCSAAS